MKKQIIFDFYNTLYNPKTEKLFKGSLTLLSKLKRKYRFVLVTTYSPKRLNQIAGLKLISLFQLIIICPKKDINIFKDLSIGFDETIIIGDRKEEEIFFAEKLNLRFLLVNPKLKNPYGVINKSIKRKTL